MLIERGSVTEFDDREWPNVLVIKSGGNGRALIQDGIYHLRGAASQYPDAKWRKRGRAFLNPTFSAADELG